jgi:hypothetical protein
MNIPKKKLLGATFLLAAMGAGGYVALQPSHPPAPAEAASYEFTERTVRDWGHNLSAFNAKQDGIRESWDGMVLSENFLTRSQKTSEAAFIYACYGLAYAPLPSKLEAAISDSVAFDAWRRSVLAARFDPTYTKFGQVLNETVEKYGVQTAANLYPRGEDPKVLGAMLTFTGYQAPSVKQDQLQNVLELVPADHNAVAPEF